jgi:hypothetical protein
MRTSVAFLCLSLFAAPLAAKDSLGVFGQWGAFRDPQVPRCYAIAAAEPETRARPRDHAPFASIGTWPARGVRGQLHIRLSRTLPMSPRVSLSIGGQRFVLTGGGADVWAADPRMDAAIVAAMRSAGSMSVSATDRAGRRFTDRYSLDGAATAMDAATVGCARQR